MIISVILKWYIYIYIYIIYYIYIYYACLLQNKFHARFGYKESPPHCLNKNIATSHALYTFIAVSVDDSKYDKESKFLMSHLTNLVPVVCSYINSVADGIISINNYCRIDIDKHGQVFGFKQSIASLHVSIKTMIAQETWLHKHTF